MPTNEFQQLVHLVERTLCSRNAKITESVELPAHGIDQDFREVDILVEEQLGPYKIRVALEATKLGRKMGIQKYDSLSHKYIGNGVGRVLVDKFVIVTERGFADSVYRKAEKEGVELVTVRELRNSQCSDTFSINPPHICALKFSPDIPGLTTEDVFESGHIEMEDGFKSCVRGLMRVVIRDRVLPAKPTIFRELVQTAMRDGSQTAHWSSDLTFNASTTLFVGDQSYPVNSVRFWIHQTVKKTGKTTVTCIERVSTTQGTKKVWRTTADFGRMKMEFAVSDDPKSLPSSVNLKISGELMAEMMKGVRGTPTPPQTGEAPAAST